MTALFLILTALLIALNAFFVMGEYALVRSRTAASISAALSPGGSTSRVTCGSSSTSVGKSHSCVTATTSSPSPRANSVSVADGTRLAIRTG